MRWEFCRFPCARDALRKQDAAPDEIRVSSHAYVATSPYSIRVETKLVELSVAVRDWNGHALAGLSEEFHIYDEGKERGDRRVFRGDYRGKRAVGAIPSP